MRKAGRSKKIDQSIEQRADGPSSILRDADLAPAGDESSVRVHLRHAVMTQPRHP